MFPDKLVQCQNIQPPLQNQAWLRHTYTTQKKAAHVRQEQLVQTRTETESSEASERTERRPLLAERSTAAS